MKVEKIDKRKEELKIVFMGTPDYALESLKALVENNFNVVAVYSQPDKPKGRGMQLQMTPTKEYAISKNIPVYQPTKIRNLEAIDEFKNINADLAVVVAYGKILPKEFLDLPRYGCINVHGSVLPAYRGAAPIQWSIINGDLETGVTTMFMDEGMDTGDMLEIKTCKIDLEDTYETLHDKLKVIGANALIETLNKYLSGTLERKKQPDNFTVAPMIKKEEMRLDFSKTSSELNCMVRGTNPFPCSRAILIDENGEEKVFKIYKAVERKIESNLSCGEIVTSNPKEGLLVKTKDSSIEIEIIQAPNSKKMLAKEYLRGKEIKGKFKC